MTFLKSGKTQAFDLTQCGAALLPVTVTFLFRAHPEAAVWLLIFSVAGLFAIRRPDRFPGRWVAVAFGALLVSPLFALLPADWFGLQPWRVALVESYALNFGGLNTINPRSTLATLAFFYAGLGYAWWCCSVVWRPRAVEILSVAIVALVTAFSAYLIYEVDEPLRSAATLENYGLPFLTRNVLTSFLAMGAMLAFARGLLAATLDRRSIFGWGAMLAVIFLAMLGTGSRSGPLLLTIGGFLFLFLYGIRTRRFGLFFSGVALVALAYGTVQLIPGETAQRIRDTLKRPVEADAFRWSIHRDAVRGVAAAPLFGHGVGTFDAIFPFYRVSSARDFRVQHAENDTLMAAVERGAPAALIGVGLVVLFGSTALREAMRDAKGIRLAAFAAFSMPIVQGFWDVPLHTPPVFFLACLLLSFCWSDPPEEIPDGKTPLPFRLPVDRLFWWSFAGLSLVLSATAWVARYEVPTDGVRWQDWESRGHEALKSGDFDEARRAFAIARTLEPFSVAVAEEEAFAWFRSARPDYGVEAARDSVVRSVDRNRWARLESYLGASGSPEVQREIMDALPSREAPWVAVWMRFVDDGDFPQVQAELAAQLASGEKLDDELQERVRAELEKRGVSPSALPLEEKSSP